jgi:hypothetical protein
MQVGAVAGERELGADDLAGTIHSTHRAELLPTRWRTWKSSSSMLPNRVSMASSMEATSGSRMAIASGLATRPGC